MRFENVSIIGLAYIDAPHGISSTEIEEQLAPTMKRFHVPEGLLESLTGIKMRRFWDDGVQPSDVATQAAEKALQEAGLADEREKIGILVNTSVSKDYIEPSVASLVHGNLKLSPHALNFDIGNACLGFINGIQVIANMIEMGQVDYGMVVNGESSRYAIEKTIERLLTDDCTPQQFRSEFATLTLGSSATAMVLARSELAENGHQVTRAMSMAATEHNRLCLGQPDQMVTDHKKLLVSGLELSDQMRLKMHDVWGIWPNDFDEIIIHQVSATHTDKLIETIQIDDHKVNRMYPDYGNVGPAGVPLVLAKSAEAGRIKKGDRVGLFGIGSGLNSTAMEVIW